MFMFTSTFFTQNNNDIIDAAGDIIIVAADNTDDDGLAFVLLDDAPNGTIISFDDDEWTGTTFDTNNGEGILRWENNTGETISAGKVIKITNADGDGISVNIGAVSEVDLGFVLSASNDQVYAYTGTTRNAPGTFLTFYGALTTSSEPTLTGTGLTGGVNALNPTNTSTYIGRYTGPTEFNGALAAVSATLTDSSNWILGSFTFTSDVIGDLTGTAFNVLLSNDLLSTVKTSIYSDDNRFMTTDSSLKIEVFNMLGKKLVNKSLANGVYILRITNTQGQVATLKKAI